MHVYLAQHGEALSEEQDSRRPLSDTGRAAVAKVANYLAVRVPHLIDPPIGELRYSGKLRARETAEILGQALCPKVRPTAVDGMQPNDDPHRIQPELESRRDACAALMLVGHLPHLARLAGLLLTGDVGKSPVRVVNAAVLRLGFRGGSWAVDWFITPACVP
jgi:phosphohistidine phosphatase